MTRKNEVLAAVLEELNAAGIKPTITYGRRQHPKVRWISPDGKVRTCVVSSTSSDRRARHNARSDVQKILVRTRDGKPDGKARRRAQAA
jgi:hypothetical protein